MISKIILLGLVAVGAFANVAKRNAAEDDCYKCSRWDSVGNGYLPSDIPKQCSIYRQCYRTQGSTVITGPIYRPCPPGTWTNFFDASNGNPCTETRCDPDLCDDCELVEPTTINPVLECPFVQGFTPDKILRLSVDADPIPYGSCGQGGYFNDTDGVCTCTVMGDGCQCRVNIPFFFETGINDVSCHKSWVGQTGYPAMVSLVFDPFSTFASSSGQFDGFLPSLNNGAHVTTYTLDGAFAGGWVFELTYTAWFKLDVSYSAETWGVVTMGDCASGPAFAIWVDNHRVQAHIELMNGFNIVDHVITSDAVVNNGEWYFVSVMYNANAADSFKMYLFDEAQYSACKASPFDPFSCPQAAPALENLKGAVSPRSCGLTIGHTGTDSQQEFFKGNIAQVKVNLAADYIFGCL